MAERDLGNDVISLLQQAVIRPVLFILVELPEGDKRIWTGPGDITWNSLVWTGAGAIIGMEAFSETVDTAAQGIRAMLNGIDEDVIDEILGQDYQGSPITVYFALWNVGRTTLYSPPGPIWKGELDSDEVERSRQGVELSLMCEHRMADILRTRNVRYCHRDQQWLYPPAGDPTYEDDHADTTDYMSRVASNGGTEGPMQRVISNAFFDGFETLSFKSKILYVLPFLGRNMGSMVVPWVDSLSAGNSTVNGFTDADAIEVPTLKGDSSATKRLNIPLRPLALGGGASGTKNGGIGVWATEVNNDAGTQYAVGCWGNSSGNFVFGLRFANNGGSDDVCEFYWGADGYEAELAEVRGNHHYYGQRSSATLRRLYKNGATAASNTLSHTPSDTNMNERDFDGFAVDTGIAYGVTAYWRGGLGVLYFTDGTLTDDEVATWHQILATRVINPLRRNTTVNTETKSYWSSAAGASGLFRHKTIERADDLVTQLKTLSGYSKIKYFLPLLGRNIAAAITPLVDTASAGRPTNIGSANFADSDFSEANGLQGNGSTKALGIPRTPAELGSSSSGGVGYWEAQPTQGTQTTTYAFAMGADGATIYGISLIDPSRRFRWGNSANSAIEATSDALGHYYGQRNGATSRRLFIDGVQVASNTASDTATNAGTRDFVLMGRQEANAGGALLYYAGRCHVAYLTDGTVSDADIGSMHTILLNYLYTPKTSSVVEVDTGLDKIEQIQDQQLPWGRTQ